MVLWWVRAKWAFAFYDWVYKAYIMVFGRTYNISMMLWQMVFVCFPSSGWRLRPDDTHQKVWTDNQRNELCKGGSFFTSKTFHIYFVFNEGNLTVLSISRRMFWRDFFCLKVLDVPLTVKIRTGVQEKSNVAHKLIPEMKKWGVSMVTVSLVIEVTLINVKRNKK